MKTLYGAILASTLSLCCSGAFASEYDVAAYVWPAYQPEPRWAELGIFGEGIGEWQNVKEAVPKWDGHCQPLVPLWGYENEADPKVVEKAQILEGLVRDVWPAFEARRFAPFVHKVMPITEATEAHAILERGENRGKVVLTA